MSHLHVAWAKLADEKRIRFPVPGAAGDLLDHLSWVHGMPVDRYKHRHVKADAIHQWHTDAHQNGDPGATGHDHSGKLRQTGWAADPENPEKSKNGGYYTPPPSGDDGQMARFLDRFDR